MKISIFAQCLVSLSLLCSSTLATALDKPKKFYKNVMLDFDYNAENLFSEAGTLFDEPSTWNCELFTLGQTYNEPIHYGTLKLTFSRAEALLLTARHFAATDKAVSILENFPESFRLTWSTDDKSWSNEGKILLTIKQRKDNTLILQIPQSMNVPYGFCEKTSYEDSTLPSVPASQDTAPPKHCIIS